MTVIEFIEAASQRLQAAGVSFGHGTRNAFDEAAWLTLWALGLPLADLDGVAQRCISSKEQARLQALLGERIHSRKPTAYLTQQAWLQGVPFYVDERAIVPRSLIAELLADGGIDPWLGARTRHVLDLCTGNGSLAVLAAMAYPDVQVLASDISTDALAVARINVDQHGLQQRIQLVQSDAFAQIAGHYDPNFDLILCNPPYVNAASMAALPVEYLAEPALALAGGIDGMDFVRRLLAQASAYMSTHAVLVLEVGHERAHFEAAYPRLPAVWLETSAGPDQVLLLTREALIGAAT